MESRGRDKSTELPQGKERVRHCLLKPFPSFSSSCSLFSRLRAGERLHLYCGENNRPWLLYCITASLLCVDFQISKDVKEMISF